QRRLDVAPHLGLLVGRHEIVARVDLARVVLDGDGRPGLPVAEDPALALGDDPVAVVPHGERVAPVAERALGELHDVALVDEGDAPAPVAEGVFDRGAGEPLGPLARHGLHAGAAGGREADLPDPHFALQERDQLPRLGALRRPLDPGVDVLGVLAKDHHVDLLGALDRARHAREPAHRAEADVVDRILGAPVLEAVECLLAGDDLHPGDAALAAVGLLDRGVEDGVAGAPEVGAGAVAPDEGDDGVGGGRRGGHRGGPGCGRRGDGDDGVRGHEGSLQTKKAGRDASRERSASSGAQVTASNSSHAIDSTSPAETIALHEEPRHGRSGRIREQFESARLRPDGGSLSAGWIAAETTCYTIVFTPRSGSNLLCDVLRANGLGQPSEYFQHPLGVANAAYYRELGVSPDDFKTFLTRLVTDKSQNGIFGVKLTWDHKNVLVEALRRHFGRNDGLVALSPRLRWVHLQRRDKIGQAISLWRASKSGIWTSSTP